MANKRPLGDNVRVDDQIMSKKIKSQELEIHEACEKGDTNKVVELINGKTLLDVNELNRKQTLLAAIENDDDVVVKELLQINGIDVDIQGDDDYTPLHLAVETKNVTCVRQLLECNAKIDMLDTDEDTPLHVACNAGNFEIAKLLVKHGAALNLINKWNGLAPLHMAADSGNLEITKLLLELT